MSREGSYVLDIAKDDTSARTYAVRRWYKYHSYKDPKRAFARRSARPPPSPPAPQRAALAQRPRAELAGVLAGELIELSDGVYVLLNPAGVETGDAGEVGASPSSRRAC